MSMAVMSKFCLWSGKSTSLIDIVVLWKVMWAVEGPAMRRYAGVRDEAMQMHSLLEG